MFAAPQDEMVHVVELEPSSKDAPLEELPPVSWVEVITAPGARKPMDAPFQVVDEVSSPLRVMVHGQQQASDAMSPVLAEIWIDDHIYVVDQVALQTGPQRFLSAG